MRNRMLKIPEKIYYLLFLIKLHFPKVHFERLLNLALKS